MRLIALALTLAIAVSACGGDSPTSPSDLKETVNVGDVSFGVNRTTLWRDFMPVVREPGPDGGARMAGWIVVRAANQGREASFTLEASVYDGAGNRHPVTVVAHDYDRETQFPGQEVLWTGSIGSGAVQWLELRLSAGPYLPVGSRAYVVLQWSERGGGRGSMRTAEVEIGGTY